MEFCPTVVWPVIPVWVMETMVVDMKLLEMKARREGVDLVSEFNAYEEVQGLCAALHRRVKGPRNRKHMGCSCSA